MGILERCTQLMALVAIFVGGVIRLRADLTLLLESASESESCQYASARALAAEGPPFELAETLCNCAALLDLRDAALLCCKRTLPTAHR